MTAIMPAPAYILARPAWIPILVIWHADGRFTRLEGAPCEEYAAAPAASWRPATVGGLGEGLSLKSS
jgi:hypothetical protein